MGTTWHMEVRNKSREEIIQAAQHLFLLLDFSDVGIKDICTRAGVSRVTFYKCFNSIVELAFEVQINVMSEMIQFIDKHFDAVGTGIQKLEKILNAWLEFVKMYPNHMKYIGFFDHYYRDRNPNPELTERYKVFVHEDRNGMRLSELIRQGMEDGTIRDDLDVKQTAAVIFESTISILQRMTSIGETIKQEHGVQLEDIAKTMFDMVIQYVKKKA
ncbi:TetR/AcrR family transcriptional regulator [Cohnella sp. WQ 127256]|uniref:TetR/AcrR family transcriptional regulator n=1 Tax=Cohnella sp. WQ 127256 TaxID=2938790 RepID=UPI002117530C|nr:TetR/AcrR family transcriptional regulator [Cohnella sp. WQ 127256]